MRRRPIPYSIKLRPDRRDEYGNALAAIAVCACGHEAQLPDAWVRLAGACGVEMERERAKLKCSKYGGRMPRVEVYRVPD